MPHGPDEPGRVAIVRKRPLRRPISSCRVSTGGTGAWWGTRRCRIGLAISAQLAQGHCPHVEGLDVTGVGLQCLPVTGDCFSVPCLTRHGVAEVGLPGRRSEFEYGGAPVAIRGAVVKTEDEPHVPEIVVCLGEVRVERDCRAKRRHRLLERSGGAVGFTQVVVEARIEGPQCDGPTDGRAGSTHRPWRPPQDGRPVEMLGRSRVCP